MRHILLGDSGVEVSAICLGTMRFGTATDEATSFAILDRYLEAGGAFLDTANVYAVWEKNGTGGDSERLLRRWMAERRCRDRVVLATKLGSRLQPSGRGLRAEQIREECEKSLRRLGTDRIDLYYSHFFDPVTPVEESLAAFDALRQAGKVRFIGASNHPAWRLAEANALAKVRGWAPYCCIQQRISVLAVRPQTKFAGQVAGTPELLDYCRERRVTVLAYSPLLGGLYGRADRKLDDSYALPENDARLAALRAVAAEKAVSPNVLVLAWMLHHDPLILPIFAVSTEAQMRENLQALGVQLSPEEMARLAAAPAAVKK